MPAGRTEKNFRVRPLSPNQASLATVRQFQSETDAIREAAEPLLARATLFVMAGFLVCVVAIMCFTRVDRVITSVSGRIVPVDQINVLQVLDASIIKTIDIREGQQVETGQLLATLDSTFTAADVSAIQVADRQPGGAGRPRRGRIVRQAAVIRSVQRSGGRPVQRLAEGALRPACRAVPRAGEQLRFARSVKPKRRSRRRKRTTSGTVSAPRSPARSRICARRSPKAAADRS